MSRKIFAAGAGLLLLFSLGLTGCGDGSASAKKNPEVASSEKATMKQSEAPASTKPAEQPVQKPVDIVGNWESAENNGSKFIATITDNTIEIWLSQKDTEDKFLYWVGTVEKPNHPGEFKWESKGDKEKLESSLLGSQSPTKEFTVKGDTINFEFTAMGQTRTVQLRRVANK